MTSDKKFFLRAEHFIAALVCGWLIAASGYLIFDGSMGASDTSTILGIGVVIFIISAVLVLFAYLYRTVFHIGIMLCASGLLYAAVTLTRNSDFYTIIGVIAALFIILFYLSKGDKLRSETIQPSKKATLILLGIGSALFAIYVGGLCVLRYTTYMSPNYDFGIFAQMFHYMKETFAPLTTCERDGLLSHFNVHMSPIFYVFLPVYYILPYPATIIVLQALLLASGVIPLYLIAKKFGLSNKAILFFCFIYLTFPALIGGCFYDVHENKFLAPLLLWLLYFSEKDNLPLTIVFSLLTCAVKEDAAVYVAFVALYLFASRKQYRNGSIIFAVSVLYFCGAVWYLETYGLGVMSYRYDNFSGAGGGLLGVIIRVFLEPSRVLTQSFSTDKLRFCAYMLLPLGALPFATKKLSRFILLCPMLLVNLMPDYVYQYSIDFQYTYGVTALLFYLAIMNLSEMRTETRRSLAALAVASAFSIGFVRAGTHTYPLTRAIEYRETISAFDAAVAAIPDGASVSATTFFAPHLSNREELYVIESRRATDYVIVDLRTDEWSEDERYYASSGYQYIYKDDGIVAVLKNPAAD